MWDWFGALNATRQSGMGPGPITFLEIEAFQRLCLVQMTAWEVGLIRRLDQAVIKAWGEKAAKAAKPAPEPQTTDIPVEKPNAIKTLFRGLAAQKAAQLGQPPT